MTTTNLGRWLLVTIAIVGLAAAAPAVSAHGDDTVQENETAAETPAHGDEAGWVAWMERHMGPDAVDDMASHMGATVDEMAQWMAGDGHQNTGHTTDGHATGGHATGMNGQGHGC